MLKNKYLLSHLAPEGCQKHLFGRFLEILAAIIPMNDTMRETAKRTDWVVIPENPNFPI